MDSIFKTGQEVWFSWELDGKLYESLGKIDEVYYIEGKHKYRIIANSPRRLKPFFIWEDKISFYKKEDRDKLRCADCKYADCSIYDNSTGKCASCFCSHRLFEPNESCDIKKLEEAYSKAEAMCDKAEKVHPFMLGDLVVYKDASKPITFTVIEVIEYKSPQGAISYSYRIKRTNTNNPNSDTIVHIVDHDRLEKVDKSKDKFELGGYIYPVGANVRFNLDDKTYYGVITNRIYDARLAENWYWIKTNYGKTYHIPEDHIKGYSIKWGFDLGLPTAVEEKVFHDICENIKKQVDYDQNTLFQRPWKFILDTEEPNSVVRYIDHDKSVIKDELNKMFGVRKDNNMKTKNEQKKRNRNIIKTEKDQRTIKDISFNGPAVIVKFEPTGNDLAYGRFKGDKVVVVCKDDDTYDKKTGFLLAILKEFLNNQSYGNILEKLDSFDAFDIPQLGKDDKKSGSDSGLTQSKFGLRDRVETKTGCGIYTITDMNYNVCKKEWEYECTNGTYKRTFSESRLIPSKY